MPSPTPTSNFREYDGAHDAVWAFVATLPRGSGP